MHIKQLSHISCFSDDKNSYMHIWDEILISFFNIMLPSFQTFDIVLTVLYKQKPYKYKILCGTIQPN